MTEPLFNRHFDWFWRVSLAQFITFIFFIANIVSFSMPEAVLVRPYFILIAIYYWSIYRPTFLSPLFIFILGLLYDLILAYPLGLHSIIFIAVQWIVISQRLFFLGQSYMAVWLSFACLLFGVSGVEWLFFCFYLGSIVSFKAVFFSFLVTFFILPLMTTILVLAHRILPSESRSYF